MNNIEEIANVFSEPGEEKQRALLGELRQSSDGEQILLALARGVHGPGIRRWAIEGLAAYKSRRAKATIVEALQDEHMTVRLHAIHAITNAHMAGAYLRIMPLLRDPSGGIRVNALQALAHKRFKGLRAEVENMLNDDKQYVRDMAQEVLANWP